jgi:DNA-binding XRE family transcriptional regulator
MSTEMFDKSRTRPLREKRDYLRVKQKDLAVRLGIKEATLIDLERQGIPDFDRWERAIEELATERNQREAVTTST